MDIKLTAIFVSKPAFSILGDRARKPSLHCAVIAHEVMIVRVWCWRPEDGRITTRYVGIRNQCSKWMLRWMKTEFCHRRHTQPSEKACESMLKAAYERHFAVDVQIKPFRVQ
jgi:hypothetical protein